MDKQTGIKSWQNKWSWLSNWWFRYWQSTLSEWGCASAAAVVCSLSGLLGSPGLPSAALAREGGLCLVKAVVPAVAVIEHVAPNRSSPCLVNLKTWLLYVGYTENYAEASVCVERSGLCHVWGQSGLILIYWLFSELNSRCWFWFLKAFTVWD